MEPLAIEIDTSRKGLKLTVQPVGTFIDSIIQDRNPIPDSLKGIKDYLSQSKSKLLWYPSSGDDFTPIVDFNKENIPDIENPGVIIFTDSSFDHYNGYGIENLIRDMFVSRGIQLNLQSSLIRLSGRNGLLVKINIESEKKWLIYLDIDNFEFLANLLLNWKELKINYLYTACDGQTNGMMGAEAKWKIPTYFILPFFNALGIKFHVTVYSKYFFIENKEDINAKLQTHAKEFVEKYGLKKFVSGDIEAVYNNLVERMIDTFHSKRDEDLFIYKNISS